MFYKGTISNYIYHFFMENKAALNNIKNAEQLRNQFTENKFSWSQLSAFAARDSIAVDDVSPAAKEKVLQKMPAYLARQLFRTEGYYELVNEDDAMIKKALQTLGSN